MTWTKKARILYYLLHPQLGNGDRKETSERFGVKYSTLKGWLTKKEHRRIWVPMLKIMPFEEFGLFTEKQIKPDAVVDVSSFSVPTTGPMVVFQGFNNESGRSLSEKAKKSQSVVFLGTNTRRLKMTLNYGKHEEAEKLLLDNVVKGLETGMPMMKAQAKTLLKNTFGSQPESSFYKAYLDPSKSWGENQMMQWMTRVLKKNGYSVRKSTVSQELPKEYRAIAEEWKDRLQLTLQELDPDVILNADETFLEFNQGGEEVLAVVGSKRVRKGFKQKVSKECCTLMVTVEKLTGRILEPTFVMTGEWNGKLMKE